MARKRLVKKSLAEKENQDGSSTFVPLTKSHAQEGINAKAKKSLNSKKPSQNFITRTVWTLIMIALFFAVLAMGHFWVVILVTLIQIGVYKEVIAIASVPSREKDLPWTKFVSWYFLMTTLYYAYGESIFTYFHHLFVDDSFMLPFVSHHRFISFMLYIMGFVLFVASLQKGKYKFQFSQFCWTHMTLLLVVGQAHFIINNIFEGLFWFFVPVCYVVCNDVFAYLCGKMFGKHPLIEVSPKKTIEGFLGGWLCTVVVGSLITFILMRYEYFICPSRDLSTSIFTGLTCTPNSVFLPHTYNVPSYLVQYLHLPDVVTFAPIYFHLAMFATFSSLVAPFGGFFASGLKRAFKIKDFGDSIPGHGGLTDRVDCQFLNGVFVYMYFQSFIAEKNTSTSDILDAAISTLTTPQQLQLLEDFQNYLVGQGKITADAICNRVVKGSR
ncbi:phosphatidate cytidylyltransferase [Schizosaccharomyces cryophilus OY26]|uniref:Phosphatidate cytidylyltransferase n=1 Tax=Schizosaccharomyces cryophilus (strain OY26 / ATCC MYA-4695 / CBS 11777 / NBRC 106824 / NRRL Y48691) TaxID=653667 RepID=S9X0H4_SCHCR|nr:phosphatidate cytidylyltransferase [Schizosaccharomyces cryophilus OY26]EPY50462.1 phosphatidate cytidylyltransferase [Schizosaccharomyces cryophilus OY26]